MPQQLFAPDEYYAWLVDPNPVRQLVLAVAMVAVVLAGVMFPLWPVKMRIGVWYLSVGVLGLIAAFFGLAIVRLVLWLVTKVVARPGIWLFPNLFADVGFVRLLPSVSLRLLRDSPRRAVLTSPRRTPQVDSFIPVWGWDVPPPKKAKKSSKSSSGDGVGAGSSDKKASKRSKKAAAAGDAPRPAPAPAADEGPRITEIGDDEDDE